VRGRLFRTRPPGLLKEHGWASLLRLRNVWASLAIFAMWIAVAVASVWGPDAVFQSNDGNGSTIPTGVFVALFASRVGVNWSRRSKSRSPRHGSKPTTRSRSFCPPPDRGARP
jgi:hypothetical protein